MRKDLYHDKHILKQIVTLTMQINHWTIVCCERVCVCVSIFVLSQRRFQKRKKRCFFFIQLIAGIVVVVVVTENGISIDIINNNKILISFVVSKSFKFNIFLTTSKQPMIVSVCVCVSEIDSFWFNFIEQ